MSDTVIQVDHLWKKYRLGVLGTGTLRHDFNRWLHRTLGKPDPYAKVGEASKTEDGRSKIEAGRAPSPNSQLLSTTGIPSPLSTLPSASSSLRDDEMWALRDVSFEVKQGEILGIIGRNGAGKSTLLKILSRVTAPSSGEVRVKGRMASLLEVGTGFHPELTGRENIFLNGAILGMTKTEIRSKLDEIVAFAEVEKFIDTPVKRYSSGMYVRLAFAVAAHLEPEILIVDEVLAVGDAEFQKKCLGKLQSVATNDGRTVLFVSHNMNAIERLCDRCLLFTRGQLAADLEPEFAISKYLETGTRHDLSRVDLTSYSDRTGDGSARIVEASLRDAKGNLSNCFSIGDSIIVECIVEYRRESDRFSHSVEVANSDGVPIYHLWDMDSRSHNIPHAHRRLVRARIAGVDLCPDRYFITLWAGDTQGNRADRLADCLSFTIEQSNSQVKRTLNKGKGLIYKVADWSYAEA
jgi:lipopolysaccharide transport system ATP-binding protein